MESSPNTLRSYSLALLTLMGNEPGAEDDPPFGWAMRLVKTTTVYSQAAHKIFQALIEYSPSPDTVARDFLTELAKCENAVVADLVNELLAGDRSASPDDWAAYVNNDLKENGGNISSVTSLANYFVTNLIVAFRNPPGKTPQDSQPPTPDPDRTREISSLLESATIARNQGALKELVFRRDNPRCPITAMSFEGDGSVIPQCAHIIPFSFVNKEPVLTAIEMFTGKEVSADIIQHFINHPANAINLETNAHDSMDKKLAWGIEALSVNNEWKYYFRVVKLAGIPMFVRFCIQDGDEITFGKGNVQSHGTIALPDPRLCNLHLAVARVFAASGFAEVYEKYLRDHGEEEIGFGEELARRLDLAVIG
ncbi:hypothetical protein F5888DRAFT_1906980 [Russula emetica]|nr:hypothetical protein F5888DRAFT_1906980 [Russula emetica]